LPRALPAAAVAVVTAGVVLLTGVAAAAAPSDVNDFEFESMHVDFTLTRDADGASRLRAVETIVALFPEFDQNRGIVRDIPSLESFGAIDAGGLGRIDHDVDVVSITDENGDPVPFEEWGSEDY